MLPARLEVRNISFDTTDKAEMENEGRKRDIHGKVGEKKLLRRGRGGILECIASTMSVNHGSDTNVKNRENNRTEKDDQAKRGRRIKRRGLRRD